MGRVLDVDLQALAQLAGVLVEGRLEPAGAQPAAGQPVRRRLRQGLHFLEQRWRIDVGRAEEFQRPRGAASLGQRRPLEHHRAGVAARHREVGRVRAGVDPAALVEWPAVAGCRVRLPALHRDHLALDVEFERGDEPARHFAQRQPVPHRHRPGADEAFPAGAQRQALDGTARRVRPVQHPHRLAAPRRGLEHVAQRGDEGVDAAAEILQVDQQHVEAVHHDIGRPPHFAVEAEHRDAVRRIEVVGRFHHVVLFVAAQAVLRAEGCRQLDVGQRGERVDGMDQVARRRGRVGEQRYAAAGERAAQRGVLEETVETELHAVLFLSMVSAKAAG